MHDHRTPNFSLRTVAAAVGFCLLGPAASAAPTLVQTIDLSTWVGTPVSPWNPPLPPSPNPGFSLTSVAYNPVLNTLYVADSATAYVYIIDAATLTVSAVSNTQGSAVPANQLGSYQPLSLLTNPVSGRWAVVSPYFGSKFTGTAIALADGPPAGTMPSGASWDPVTDIVYSGRTNFFAMLNLKFLSGGFACAGTSNATTFHAATNRAYVSCGFSDTAAGIVAYDGNALLKANKKVGTSAIGSSFIGRPHQAALGLAVNANTNRLYAAGLTSATSLDVLDASTLQLKASINGLADVTRVSIQSSAIGAPLPLPVAVNTRTNTVFVLDALNSQVSVFDGATNTLTGTINVPVPAGAVVDNPAGELKIGNTIVDGNRGVTSTLGGAVAMALNEASNLLYVASVNGTVGVYALDAPAAPTTFSASGIVSDAVGSPVAGVNVTATGAAGTAVATTDSQGLFVLTGLAGGLYSVRPNAVVNASYAAQSITVGNQNVSRLAFAPASGKTFTVSVGRSNSGTVSATPSGTDRALNCGSACSAKFTGGTAVTLTATPAPGLAFLSWGGACAGTAPTCTITVNSDLSVQANFSK